MGIYPISFTIHSLEKPTSIASKNSIYLKSIPYIRKILLYESPFHSGPAKNGPYSQKFHISEFLVSGIGCMSVPQVVHNLEAKVVLVKSSNFYTRHSMWNTQILAKHRHLKADLNQTLVLVKSKIVHKEWSLTRQSTIAFSALKEQLDRGTTTSLKVSKLHESTTSWHTNSSLERILLFYL